MCFWPLVLVYPVFSVSKLKNKYPECKKKESLSNIEVRSRNVTRRRVNSIWVNSRRISIRRVRRKRVTNIRLRTPPSCHVDSVEVGPTLSFQPQTLLLPTLYTVALYTVSLYTFHCTLYSVYICTLYTIHCILFTLHFTLYYVLCIM